MNFCGVKITQYSDMITINTTSTTIIEETLDEDLRFVKQYPITNNYNKANTYNSLTFRIT